MDRGLQGSQLERARRDATKGGEEGRNADIPVAAVADDDHIRCQQVRIVGEDLGKTLRRRLLLTLEEDLDTDRQALSVRRDSAEMHDYARLVIRGAASVDPSVLLERLERTGVPIFDGTWRLHVVMGIEEEGWGALGCLDLAKYCRMATTLQQLSVGEACVIEARADALCGIAH